jgi:hypothetical protein
MVAVVVMADLWPHTVWHRLLRKSGESLTRDPSVPPTRLGWQAFLLPAIVVFLALGLQFSRVPVPVVGSDWVRLNPHVVPIDMTGPVQEYAQKASPGSRIYNDANFGGFLIFYAPELKIFMDDRFELCGDAWLANYVDVINNHPERFEAWYQEYHFDRALVATGKEMPPLEKYLRDSGKWREVARGEIAVLFERVDQPAGTTGAEPRR